MNLSNDSLNKLSIWVKSDTWHTGHDLDQNLFFEFVNQYTKDQGFHVDEAMLTEKIGAITSVKISSGGPLVTIIRDRVSLMVNIMDFLKMTNR